jgi:recombination protein RecT
MTKEIVKKEETNLSKKEESGIVNDVLLKIKKFEQYGELKIPKDYNAENALKSAYLILTDLKDRDNKPVLTSCTKESIANSLLDMVVQGLSPLKKQCAFVSFGGKLTLVREYPGNIALAKRFGGVKSVTANVIYAGDEFEYSIDSKTGIKMVTKHVQKLENIDKEIKGAYATLILNDDSTYVDIMSIMQIKMSWLQGFAKGQSPAHKSFTGEMAKKTVISRACKLFVSSSDDSGVYEEGEEKEKEEKEKIAEMNFDDAEEIKQETKIEEVVEQTKPEEEPISEIPKKPGEQTTLFEKEKKAPF